MHALCSTHPLCVRPCRGPQDVASAVLTARDAAQLIAVTHPAAARQMQRVAAQMIAALQLLASDQTGP